MEAYYLCMQYNSVIDQNSVGIRIAIGGDYCIESGGYSQWRLVIPTVQL